MLLLHLELKRAGVQLDQEFTRPDVAPENEMRRGHLAVTRRLDRDRQTDDLGPRRLRHFVESDPGAKEPGQPQAKAQDRSGQQDLRRSKTVTRECSSGSGEGVLHGVS